MTITSGEFGLIRRIRQRVGAARGDALLGIGDDTAVLRPPPGRLLASCDMMVEGTHFERDMITPWQLGWKALAANISDIAAMGGTPLYALVSMGLADWMTDSYVESVYEGMLSVANRFRVQIVGGDTVRSSDRAVVDVAILGSADTPITRSGARVGDLIAVTGCLGASAAGLQVLRTLRARDEKAQGAGHGLPWLPELVRAHFEPEPRVEEGLRLARTGAVTSMMDISDGLASEVHHIAEESAVGAIVDAAAVPLSQATMEAARLLQADALDWALFGGEDYELVFTFPPESQACIVDSLAVVGGRAHVVGRVVPADQGLRLRLAQPDGATVELAAGGYDHFARIGQPLGPRPNPAGDRRCSRSENVVE